MTNELERVVKLARALELRQFRFPTGVAYIVEPEELLAFEQAVLAKRDAQYWDAESAAKEMDKLQAKLAMQTEALTKTQDQLSAACRRLGGTAFEIAFDMLNYDTSEADVDAFTAKKKAEWEKGVLEETISAIETMNAQTRIDVQDVVDALNQLAEERGGVR